MGKEVAVSEVKDYLHHLNNGKIPKVQIKKGDYVTMNGTKIIVEGVYLPLQNADSNKDPHVMVFPLEKHLQIYGRGLDKDVLNGPSLIDHILESMEKYPNLGRPVRKEGIDHAKRIN